MQTSEMPDQPARCVGCASSAVRVLEVSGHRVWCCPDCERTLARPAGVATGSHGRVVA